MCDLFIQETKKKNLFVNFACFRVVKLVDLDWWSQKFPRMDSLARKKILMIDRTLTTPNITIQSSW